MQQDDLGRFQLLHCELSEQEIESVEDVSIFKNFEGKKRWLLRWEDMSNKRDVEKTRKITAKGRHVRKQRYQ